MWRKYSAALAGTTRNKTKKEKNEKNENTTNKGTTTDERKGRIQVHGPNQKTFASLDENNQNRRLCHWTLVLAVLLFVDGISPSLCLCLRLRVCALVKTHQQPCLPLRVPPNRPS